MEVDLRTPLEKARDEKHEQIRSWFLRLSNEQPDAAPSRIFAAIAANFNMTAMGVRRICERGGLYQSKNH
ncbi:MAG: hypothetical protein IJ200_12835 [Prevotella sp.]|nr:hypothetical protein [Prevotella sp.]